MKLPEITPFQFQGSAQSLKFDPTKIPDPNPYANQHLSAIQESFKNFEKGGLGQLAEEYQGFQDLMKLTETGINLTLKAAEINKQFQESRANQEFFKLYQEGKLDRDALTAPVKAVDAQGELAAEAAFEAAQAGADFDLTEYIRNNFSGHGYTRISKLLYKYAMDAQHGAYIQEQLDFNETETVVTDRNGNIRTVKINDKTLTPYERRQVVSELDRAFETVPYIAVLSQEVRAASGGFEKRASTIKKINDAYTKQYNINQGENIRANVFSAALTDFKNGVLTNYNSFVKEVAATVDKEGKLIGLAGARHMIQAAIYNNVEATGDTTAWENLKKVPSHTGKPLGEQYRAEFDGYANKVRDARDGYFQDKQRSVKIEMTMDNGAFVTEAINGEGMGDSAFEDQIKYSRDVALQNGLSEDDVGIPALVTAQKYHSLSGRALAQGRETLRNMLKAGTLTTSHELLLNPTLRQEFYNDAKKNEETRMSTASFEARKRYSRAIAEAANAPVDLDGTIGGDLGTIVAEIIENAETRAAIASEIPGINYDDAFVKELSQATSDFTQQIQRGSGHRYEKNDSGEFFRFRQAIENPDKDSAQYAYDNRVARIVDAVRGKDLKTAVTENISAFASEAVAQKAVARFDSTGQVPAQFRGAAERLGYDNGVDMLRAVADGYGIPMKTTKEVFAQQTSLSPKERRFIDALRSDNYFNVRSAVLTSDSRRRPGFEAATPPPVQAPPAVQETSTEDARALDLIAKFESQTSGNYNAVNQIGTEEGHGTKGYSGDFTQMTQHNGRELTDLTVQEIMDLQFDDRSLTDDQWIEQGKLHAVGRYQIVGSTFAGLVRKLNIDPNAKFSPQIQDQMGLQLLKESGWRPWIGAQKLTDEEKAFLETYREVR